MEFEEWIRAQLQGEGAAPARSRRRGRFFQGLVAGAALTVLVLGAISAGTVPSLKLEILRVQPQALPVTTLAGAPTVPDSDVQHGAATPDALAAGAPAGHAGSAPGAAPGSESHPTSEPGHLASPLPGGEPELAHTDGGHSPGGSPTPSAGGSPDPDGSSSGSGRPPGH